jgi:hypothetical protein
MPDNEICPPTNKRTPWNKGKLIGARPPLRPKHVWSIRTRLLLEGRIRDLALFNLAIDSKLRGCDVVAVKVEDVAPNGYTMDRRLSAFLQSLALGLRIARAAEEDRAVSQVRANGSDPSSHRRLLEGDG